MKSPSGGSILMTSAPRSASSRVQYGPDTMVVKSSTRTPARTSLSNGCLGAIQLFCQREVVAIEAFEMLLHLGHCGVTFTGFEMFDEASARRQHPRISPLSDGADKM